MTGRNRYANVDSLNQYMEAVEEETLPRADVTSLTPEVRFKDALIMGLRLVEGIDLSRLGERYGVDAESFVKTTVGDLQSWGLIRIEDSRAALTPRGRLLSNIVFSRWV
jgi:oxygen-independent coproporphyrinogen-3 oxidase